MIEGYVRGCVHVFSNERCIKENLVSVNLWRKCLSSLNLNSLQYIIYHASNFKENHFNISVKLGRTMLLCY